MFGDQETFTGIHVDTLPLLHRDNLESTQALYFYDLIRIDPFGYHRDKISQETLYLSSVLAGTLR
jgi:hypothetical protein